MNGTEFELPDPLTVQPYFNSQVEHQARLLSRRPSSLKAIRPLGADNLRAYAARGAVVQFVVTDSGRIVMSTLKFLSGAESVAETRRRAVHDALARLRFAPARVGGKPVNVLEQYVLEW